jgi:hypothetical protein
MKKLTTLVLFICFLNAYSQKYVLANEKVIFSFQTQKGKMVSLVREKNNKYIVYRFGTKDTIELQYPEMNSESWKKFKFCFYSRGGGKQNSAMDLNSIWFTKNGYEYLLYSRYHIGDEFSPESFKIGIAVTNLETKKEVEISGNINTAVGSLHEFRTNGLIEIDPDRID